MMERKVFDMDPFNPSEKTLAERLLLLTSSAHALTKELGSVTQEVVRQVDLKGRVQRHPYGMLLFTTGMGYLLGGGLFSSMTARMMQMGLKLGALPWVREEMLRRLDDALRSSNEKGPTLNVEPSSPKA